MYANWGILILPTPTTPPGPVAIEDHNNYTSKMTIRETRRVYSIIVVVLVSCGNTTTNDNDDVVVTVCL